MLEFTEHNNYLLQVGGREPAETHMLMLLARQGYLQPSEVVEITGSASAEEEEADIARLDSSTASGGFEKNRSEVRGELKAITDFVFREYGLPRENGLDIGSGESGEMVQRLLPIGNNIKTWTQLEVSPSAVEVNSKRHPRSDIRQGSYLSLDQGDQDLRDRPIITGLSSLDATCFIDKAIEQIRMALSDGGFLFHVQDVRPGNGVVMQQLYDENCRLPYDGYFLNGGDNKAIAYRVGDSYVSVGELFRRRLGQAISSNAGMELLFNDWITARQALGRRSKEARFYFLNVLMKLNPDIVDHHSVSTVVTVARKR